ncbi:hypothetical protein QL285_079374 [Trifolium repens]|nr:hypothetical protein QL285_079374 [Trifolium repens]
MNTDGTSKSFSSAGCGGLIHMWMERCSSYMEESWTVLVGLQLAWTHGLKQVELHMASKVVNISSSKTSGSVSGGRLIQHIVQMLGMGWEMQVCHSYHEADHCANVLANLGCEGSVSIIYYEDCPT